MSSSSSRGRTAVRVLLPALAFLVMGWCWAFASPPGSAADDDYHLTSIWCAWGDSETCDIDPDPMTVTVPEYVVGASCYAFRWDLTGACSRTLTGEMVATDRFNALSGQYPVVFHTAMRAFVGPDINRSVLIMRMVNVAIAAGLLALALWVAKPAPRRGVALAWMVGLIPTGAFFIASTNPSSWVITGVGLFWAFFYTLVTQPHLRSRQAILALVGSIVCAVMALGSRSDSAVYLGISVLAVLIVAWPRIRHRWVKVTSIALPAVFLAVAIPFTVGQLARQPLVFPGATLATDQPNPSIKTLLELPHFLASIVGIQAPSWSQRSEPASLGVEGWYTAGFSYGVGWTDVLNPSIAGIFAFASLAGVVFISLTAHSRRRVIAGAFIAAVLIVQVLYMRAVVAFNAIMLLQPRYFVPPLLILVGIIAAVEATRRATLTRAQAVVLVTLLSIGQAASFTVTMSRYTINQFSAWSNIGTDPGWWWPLAPSPTLLVIVSALAGVAFFAGLALTPRESREPRPSAALLGQPS